MVEDGAPGHKAFRGYYDSNGIDALQWPALNLIGHGSRVRLVIGEGGRTRSLRCNCWGTVEISMCLCSLILYPIACRDPKGYGSSTTDAERSATCFYNNLVLSPTCRHPPATQGGVPSVLVGPPLLLLPSRKREENKEKDRGKQAFWLPRARARSSPIPSATSGAGSSSI